MNTNHRQKQQSACELIFIVGAAFWVLAAYDFLVSGCELSAIALVPTLLFGVLTPAVAACWLLALRHAETTDTDGQLLG